MDKLCYLTMNLALVVLCALPLYCELKTEERLNFDLAEESNDAPEALRLKRGLQFNDPLDDSAVKLRKLKQTQREMKASKQRVGKRRGDLLKPQSRDGKHRALNAMPVTQGEVEQSAAQKSVPRKNIKSVGNRKTQPLIDGRTLKDVKPAARKREIGVTSNTDNELQKNSLDKTSLGEDTDDDDKACVDKNGPVIIVDGTSGNTNRRTEQETLTKRREKDVEEFMEEYQDEKEIKINSNRDKMKYTGRNKKYNNRNYKKPISKEKPSSKQYITQVKKTKLSRKKY